MSLRTTLDLNHDLTPHGEAATLAWARRLPDYARSGSGAMGLDAIRRAEE